MKVKVALLSASLSLFVGVSSIAATIAVIDSGVDYKHKVLADKMWSNPASPAKTVTEDGTVYENDVRGWNFADKNNEIIDYKYLGTFSPDCKKYFEIQGKALTHSASEEDMAWMKSKKEDKEFLKKLGTFANFVHGTHVSGIATHETDGARVVGMKLIPTETPGTRLAAARALRATRQGADNVLAKMFLGMLAKKQAEMLTVVGKYAKAVKAEVANGSFGTSVTAVKPVVAPLLKTFLGHEPSEEESTAYATYFVGEIVKAAQAFVDAAPSTLFVFAAANDGTNNDTLPVSPANIKTSNTIAVASTIGTEALASYSNYGAQMVEVAAPGTAIESSIPGDDFLTMSGTSMAAPFVTNVAGAVKDANPALGPSEIKKVLMDTVDVKDFLKGKVSTSGIVNRQRAIRAGELSRKHPLDEAIRQAKREVADARMELRGVTPGSDRDVAVPLPSPF